MPKLRQPFPVLVIRIDVTPDARIGHGKIELLEAIALHGSIAAAARSMNMSTNGLGTSSKTSTGSLAACH